MRAPHLSSFPVAGRILGRRRRAAVGEATDPVSLRSRGLDQTVESLLGGNQKLVV